MNLFSGLSRPLPVLPLLPLRILLLHLVVLTANLDILHGLLQPPFLAIRPLQPRRKRHEVVDDVPAVLEQGEVERDLVLVVGGGGARAAFHEGLDDGEVAAEAGPVEGGVAVLVGEVEEGFPLGVVFCGGEVGEEGGYDFWGELVLSFE